MNKTLVLDPPQETGTVIRATWAIFQKIPASRPTILIGLKKDGDCTGWLVPPGGKYEEEDVSAKNTPDPFKCARREGQEESGLTGISHMVVAHVHVTIEATSTTHLIDVILFSNWTGKLKCNHEFQWIEFFPFERIRDKGLWTPAGRRFLPSGTAEWMTQVLMESRPVSARILCGENRGDMLSSPELKPLYPVRSTSSICPT